MKNEEVNFINFSKNKNDCWSYYEGEFVNDKKNGVGSLYFNTKEKFIGEFCNDLIHGEGKFYQKDGTIIRGMWKNNQLLFIKE